ALSISAGGDATLDGLATATGDISLTVGQHLATTARGIVRTSDGMINVQAGSFGMTQGSELSAALGRILINVADDAYLTKIDSGYQGAEAAISIATGGDATLDGPVTAAGDINLTVGQHLATTERGIVQSSAGVLKV